MTQTDKDEARSTPEQPKTGDAQGGADSSGAGNILGGVQPDDEAGGRERRDTPDEA